jgi:cell migration-inducing and hyaluronan-binding protein
MTIIKRIQILSRRSKRFLVVILSLLLSSLAVFSRLAIAATCTGGTISPNTYTPGTTPADLVVSGTCTVQGSNTDTPAAYYFHTVNVINGGSLTFSDANTEFYAENILVEDGGELLAGTPTAPIGTVAASNEVTIHLWGAPADPGALCNSANCGIPTPPWGDNTASNLNPGTCTPFTFPTGQKDCFYNYETLDKADGTAPAYFGHKVLGVSYGGTLQLYGKSGATYNDASLTGCADPTNKPASCSGTSWVRLAQDALPGDMKIVVAGSLDWQDQNQIVLTTTDYLPSHSELLQISGAPSYNESANTTTINLVSAVQYPHNGQLFDLSNASFPGINKLTNFPQSSDMRAAVGLLTRNIRIISDGDTPGSSFAVNPGNPDNYFGGHTIVRQGFESVQIQGVEFYQLGQGGSIMHYPVHFHMVRATPTNSPTFVKDSSIWDSMTRWIVLHGTQGVMLARNIGYLSIGHGYYLEDGTETGNQLYANLGVFARAAVANLTGSTAADANPQNPRMAPGILTATAPIDNNCKNNVLNCPSGYNDLSHYSDSDNPSVFWIMNGMNDFEYNMAAGAGTCGACYWFVPGAISGPSQYEKWYGYAGEQLTLGRAGTTPLGPFIGNSCTSAMEGFVEVGAINACNGVNQTDTSRLKNKNTTLVMLPSPSAPPQSDNIYYPQITGLRYPTRCSAADNGAANADCSTVPVCAAGNETNCDVVVLNKFTSSFNWAQTNFAAVWLRSLWSLTVNNVVSDAQNAGINFVTSGGYDTASVIPGYWGLVRQTAMIGSSQWQNSKYTDGLANNPYVSNAGPFNPFSAKIGTKDVTGLKCAADPNSNGVNNSYCLSQNDQVSFQVSNFAGFQRLFSVYDGPIFQDTNAYLNIHPTFLTSDGTINGKILQTPAGPCEANPEVGRPCDRAGFISGGVTGIRAYRLNGKKLCFEPNAAIGWKQPNGFYYAPAFHSYNLFFGGVDIRHFVTEPLFKPNLFSFETDVEAAKKEYCNWDPGMFQGFTDIDRETVLNDDDGSLTGLSSPISAAPSPVPTPSINETISVNKETFFNAPTEAWECASDYPINAQGDAKCLPATAKTSPYEYVSTVVYPECAKAVPDSSAPVRYCADGNWGSSCTSSPPDNGCMGVPIYRQLLVSGEKQDPIDQMKRMMGQNNFQRSALTANHGIYYIDTTISKKTQQDHRFISVNTFTGGNLYDLFFLFTKRDTFQTYLLFVGKGLPANWDKQGNVNPGYEGLTLPFQFSGAGSDAGSGAWSSSYDPSTGYLTLKFDASKIVSQYALSATVPNSKPPATLGKKVCQPATMCTWNSGANQCQCNTSGPYASICSQLNAAKQTVCDWSVKDLDCPAAGCPAFQIKFPPECTNGKTENCFVADDKNHRPEAGEFNFTNDPYWNVNFNLASGSVAGQQCTYTKQPTTSTQCPLP